MSMKTKLKGALTTNDGNLRAWTGLPVGVGTPIIAREIAKSVLVADLANPDIATTASVLNVAVYASPFMLALPFLIFKKTRSAALGIIGGGIAADVALALWPTKSTSSTPATTTTEGARAGIQVVR